MSQTRHYRSGDVIIKEGDIGETAYIVRKGRVEVSKNIAGKRTILCELTKGNIFGEMGMIDEKPRSATVTAATETVLEEIHRDVFFHALKEEQDLAVKTLRVLFERLRKADQTIARMKSEFIASPEMDGYTSSTSGSAILEATTPQAASALPNSPLVLNKFPFLVGRKTRDPLSYNDLAIEDSPPYRISRHHIEIDVYGSRLAVRDRGSQLGSLVNGKPIGGKKGDMIPLVLDKQDNLLILGDKKSPYRFRLRIAED